MLCIHFFVSPDLEEDRDTYVNHVYTPNSDVAALAKRSAKSRDPRKIAPTGSCTHKNKECVHMLTCSIYVLTSLSGGREMAYSRFIPQLVE